MKSVRSIVAVLALAAGLGLPSAAGAYTYTSNHSCGTSYWSYGGCWDYNPEPYGYTGQWPFWSYYNWGGFNWGNGWHHGDHNPVPEPASLLLLGGGLLGLALMRRLRK